MKRIILLVLFTIILTGCENKEKEESKKITETNGMISYTIDGEKTDIKPTKEDGYIVNKIICDNGSDMMWDNDNWEVELTKINSKDRCKVDFTKDTSTSGYRITVTSNDTSSLDSLSKATVENGTVIIYSKSTVKSITGCNGIIEGNKVIVSNITSNQTCNIIVAQTLAGVIKKAYSSSGPRESFGSAYTITALHTATDYDNEGNFNGTTYYFTGNPNNWVSFAGKLWRIIRINGNGSVRLLYSGTGGEDGYLKVEDITNANEIEMNSDGKVQYNSDRSKPYYVGWKYTEGLSLDVNRNNTTNSTIYMIILNWYNQLSLKDKNYIDMSTIYCNDRELASGSTYSISSTFYYAPSTRVNNPQLVCNIKDQFKDGFGLITLDEIILAGGVYRYSNNENSYYYLNVNGGSSTGSNLWWTMSPYGFDNGAKVIMIYGSTSKGAVSDVLVIGEGVVRPVISLKPEVQVTGGDGSGTNPYTVILP